MWVTFRLIVNFLEELQVHMRQGIRRIVIVLLKYHLGTNLYGIKRGYRNDISTWF
jgi:hypothetical protein